MHLPSLKRIDRDDIFKVVGLQRRRSFGDWIWPAAGLLGVGLVLGAGLGLLLAPKSGKELRVDLRRRALNGSDGVTEPLPLVDRPSTRAT